MLTAETELARREGGRIVVRPVGVRLRWELTDLTSSDGHAIRGAFAATLRPVDDTAERKLLEESLLSDRPTLTSADAAAYFLSALESAARRSASALDINSILADSGRGTLLNNLTQAAKSLAFGCGLEIQPPFELELDSPTFRAAQQERRRAALQAERASRSAAMLKQFQDFRAAAPDMPAGQILQRLAPTEPAERADMLRAVLLSSAQESAAKKLWAVAGPNLIRIDSANLESGQPPSTEILTPPDTLGPFRSVQKAILDNKAYLLIGARSGVILFDPEKPDDAAIYRDATATWQGGFNSAAASGDQIWAAHSEGGLTSWKTGECDQPCTIIRSADAGFSPFSPRFLCSLSGNRWVCASENRLLEISENGKIRPLDESGSFPIVSILPIENDEICIIHEDGELTRRDSRLNFTGSLRRCGRITSAAIVPWLESVRLLLAGDDGSLLCAGLDDDLVTHYLNPYSGMRWIAVTAAADRVAAVSADRQRILLWPSWDTRKSPVEIHIPSLARHRVADVEFA